MPLPYKNLKYVASSRTSTVYSADSTHDDSVVIVKKYNRLGRDGGAFDAEKWAYRVTSEGAGPGKSAFLAAFPIGYLCRPDIILLPKKDGTLTDLLNAIRPSKLYLPDVLSITEQMLAGIEYLHHLSIAHTDIKPTNIVLDDMRTTLFDNNLSHPELRCTKIFIIDLGDVALIDMDRGGLAGTSRYRAPEVTLSLPWNGSVDWFAAGCVVFEIATGRSLFPSTTTRRARLAAVVAVLGPIPNWMGRRFMRWSAADAVEDGFGSFGVRCPRRNVREAAECAHISRLRLLKTALNDGFVYSICSQLLQISPRDRAIAVSNVIRNGKFV